MRAAPIMSSGYLIEAGEGDIIGMVIGWRRQRREEGRGLPDK